MASPQTENGYTRIANELLEALIKKRVPGQELRIVLAVARKTYGFGKKLDMISYGQIAELTNIPRARVIEHVKNLVSKRVLGHSPNNETRKPGTIWINKDFDKWKPSPKKGTSPKEGTIASPNNGTTSSPNNGTHKRKKENLQKKYIYPEISKELFDISKTFLKSQRERHGDLVKITESKIRAGADALDKLQRLDGFNLEAQILPALRWAARDSFWSKNVLSLAGLRNKSRSNEEMKFVNIMASMKKAGGPTRKTSGVQEWLRKKERVGNDR